MSKTQREGDIKGQKQRMEDKEQEIKADWKVALCKLINQILHTRKQNMHQVLLLVLVCEASANLKAFICTRSSPPVDYSPVKLSRFSLSSMFLFFWLVEHEKKTQNSFWLFHSAT